MDVYGIAGSWVYDYKR